MTLNFSDRRILLLDVHFSDIEDFCAAVRAWDVDFRPLSACASEQEIAHLRQFAIGGIDHGYARFQASINQSGAPPRGKLTFTILGPGTGPLWWRGHHVDVSDVLVFPRNSELRSISGDGFETDVLSVNDDILAAICEHHELSLPTTSVLGEVFGPTPPVPYRLRQRIRALRKGKAVAGFADYFSVVEQLVVEWDLMTGRARTGNIRGLRNRDRAMRVCLDIISGSDLTEINPAGLCDQAGVSARTLE